MGLLNGWTNTLLLSVSSIFLSPLCSPFHSPVTACLQTPSSLALQTSFLRSSSRLWGGHVFVCVRFFFWDCGEIGTVLWSLGTFYVGLWGLNTCEVLRKKLLQKIRVVFSHSLLTSCDWNIIETLGCTYNFATIQLAIIKNTLATTYNVLTTIQNEG